MIKAKGALFFAVFLMWMIYPVFLGATELPPYQKYSGSIKPGVVINKQNWDYYLPELQKLLPPSKLKWYGMGIKEGLVTMPIVKATYPRITKGQVEATKKYGGTARVGADNQLLNWVAGVPFPEPKTALEIFWNCYPNVSRGGAHDDYQMNAWLGLFKGTNYEKHFTWELFDRKYRGRTDIAPLGDMPEYTDKGVIFKESFAIEEPNEVKGFVNLRIRYWDINKADDSFAYIPALRRVRRLTGADLTDPVLGSDAIPDDFDVWRQKLDSRMKFRVVEHRDFLFPKTYVGRASKPPYDYKKHGPCLQVEWEIRPWWVLEVVLNRPDYVYSKRLIYVDATPLPTERGNYLLYWGESYDQKGRLWKASGQGAASSSEDGFKGSFNYMYMNCQTDHYTIMDIKQAYDDGIGGKTFPLKEDEVFSITGLLKKVR